MSNENVPVYERDEEDGPRKVRQGSVFEQIQALRNSDAYRKKERQKDFFEKTLEAVSDGGNIHELVRTRSKGGYLSSDDDLERITDNLISDEDDSENAGDSSFSNTTDDPNNSDSNNNSGPITAYDDLFQSPQPGTGNSLFDQPPKNTFNFDALKSPPQNDNLPQLSPQQYNNIDDLAFAKDKLTAGLTNEEVLFKPWESGSSAETSGQKQVQFKNLPENPPELTVDRMDYGDIMYNDDEVAEESEGMDGVEVTEEIEEYTEITEEEEEAVTEEIVVEEEEEPITEEVVVEEEEEPDNPPEISAQMDDVSDSSESRPIPEVVHQKAVIEESPEYDPTLEYDASDDSDEEDEEESDDEEEDENVNEGIIEEEINIVMPPPLELSEVNKVPSKSVETPKTADTEDMQSDIVSSSGSRAEDNLSMDHDDIVQNMFFADTSNGNIAEQEQHPESVEVTTLPSKDPESLQALSQAQPEINFDPENPSTHTQDRSKHTDRSSKHPEAAASVLNVLEDEKQRESIQSQRKRMLPYVLCIAVTIIIGAIVAFIIIGKQDSKERPLTVVPITQAPTGFLRSSLPTQTPVPFPTTSAPFSAPTVTFPPFTSPNAPTPPPTASPINTPTTLAPTPAPQTLPPILPSTPQDNNECINAIGPLPVDGSTISGDFTLASPDDVDLCGAVTSRGPGIWYYVLGTGGEMMAHTCINGRSDTKITIFKGTCDKPECLESNDNFCGLQSAVSWQSNYRQVYRILVSGPDAVFFFGSFELAIESRVNDECETAHGPVTIGSGPLVIGSTSEANPNAIACDGEVNESPSVFYIVRGTGAEITASVCEGSDFDVRISVLEGTCGTGLSCMVRSDVGSCTVSWDSESFVDYYIMIHGNAANDVGQFGLRLQTSAVRDNDSCENALGPLPLDGSIIEGSTSGATAERGVPFCESASTAPGVWYYVVGTGNEIQASLCSGASFDTRISVYEGGCSNGFLSNLVCVVGNDDFCGRQSLVTWGSQPGTTYYILVHGYLLANGDFQLTVTEI